MTIIEDKGSKFVFMRVLNYYLYIKYGLFLFIVYLQRVIKLFTLDLAYKRQLRLHLEISDTLETSYK